jgi:hypothetical protein
LHNRNQSGIVRVLTIKILSLQFSERYVVRRLVAAAQQELRSTCPHLELDIHEVADPEEIGRYSFVLILPTLVINEKVVCSGRFPTREEVTGWLREAVGNGELSMPSLP